MSEKIIEAKNLALNKGKNKILDIKKFSLNQGETIAIIGPNGAGKSTLMQVLMLLIRPTAGDIFFRGGKINPKDGIGYRRRMAMVFQEPLLLDTSVFNNVASGLKIRGLPREQVFEQVSVWLKKLEIGHLANRSVRYLSGGESQRVSLARALAMEPEVLFLDEPFSALDAPTRSMLIAELAGILRDTRISSVFATHDYKEIPFLADRVVALEKGRVIQEAPPREIMTRPANLTVASLVGVDNVISGYVAGRENGQVLVQAGPQTVSVSGDNFSPGEKVYLLMRLEDVKVVGEEGLREKGENARLCPTRPEDTKTVPGAAGNSDNMVRGKIKELLPHGSQFKVLADCGFPLTGLLGSDEVPDGKVGIGKDICLAFSQEKVHIIKRE